MKRMEKIAWFNLTVLILPFIVFYILKLILKNEFAYFAFFLFFLFGLRPFLFRKKKGKIGVILDEREIMIKRRARLHGFGAFCGFFLLTFIWKCIWVLYRGFGTFSVKTDVLPLIMSYGFLVFIIVKSVATIIQYRMGK